MKQMLNKNFIGKKLMVLRMLINHLINNSFKIKNQRQRKR